VNVIVLADDASGKKIIKYGSLLVGGGCSPIKVEFLPPSLSFPLEKTNVTCMVADPCGSIAICNFKVSVYIPDTLVPHIGTGSINLIQLWSIPGFNLL
jgi:hypothetical protein